MKIEFLPRRHVFVFGSNASGFHGAGSAGFAQRGEAKNNWRDDPEFLAAVNSPPGSPKRIGRLSIYGQAAGLMQGRIGYSYGIITVTKPGNRRSIPLQFIQEQLTAMCQFAKLFPDFEFLVAKLGENYAGYTSEEMHQVWQNVTQPVNVLRLDQMKAIMVLPGEDR